MATRSKQNFLKGINRRFSRKDSVSPDFFYTLQNARLFNRGDTGKVQRINGYSQWNQNTAEDYSQVLDVLNFEDKLIVLYQTDGNDLEYNVDVFNTSGGLVDALTFTSTYSTDRGSLVRSSDVIFIRPFNKILYNDGTDFLLNDYISKVPEIALAEEGLASQAEGSITPSTSPSTYGGEQATAQIRVIQNNTARGETDTFTIEFDGITTGQISVIYQDTEVDIAKKIYDALVATTISDADAGSSGTGWDVSMSKNIDNARVDSKRIYLTSQKAGDVYNGIRATINGSSYNILDSEDSTLLSRDDGDLSNFTLDTRDVYSALNSTIASSPSTGGLDTVTNLGSLNIRFNKFAFTVQTVSILSSDSTTQVATKIKNALDNSGEFGKYYNTKALSGDSVEIEANEGGDKYNSDVSMFFNIGTPIDYTDIFEVSEPSLAITGGTEADETLTLKKETDYWYKVRYRYLDGHYSRFSEPQYIYTGPSKAVQLTIQTPERDLDGGALKLQIFRKEEEENFFLIDEIDTDISDDVTEYTDNGEFNKEADDPRDNIWIKKAQTHDIVENRYVMGNITYFDENYTIAQPFGVNAGTATGDKMSPINTKARVFMRPKYDDGTIGYHTKIGEQPITATDQSIEVVQNGLVSSDDDEKTVEELAFFANYLPQTKEDNFAFNSIEIANRNLAPISDPNFYPNNTRIFFGFKYLELWKKSDTFIQVAKVFGWDSQRDAKEHGGFKVRELNSTGTFTEDFPQKLEVELFGVTLTYIRWGYRDGGAQTENAVYKLENFEALNDAASTGNLYVRLNGTSVDSLSTDRPDSEIFGNKVRVRKIIDESAKYNDLQIFTRDDDVLIGPEDSRLYLELEDSPFDDIDNENVNKYTFQEDYTDVDTPQMDVFDGAPSKSQDTGTYTLSFQLVNFQEASSATFEPYQETDASNDNGQPVTGQWSRVYYKYNWDEAVYDLLEVSLPENEDTLIYLGRKDNATGTIDFQITGFEKTDKDNINTAILANYNIYENLLQRKDVKLDKREFTNQIVWSSPLLSGETYSGGRTLENEAFFDIGTDNGELLEIKSLNNQLYAFCEKGVGRFNIGEVLTQQRGGEVFVDSSRFIGDFWWVQYNLKDLKPNTIRRVQNAIFYSDGYDVFRMGGQGPQNITQGIIPLDPDNNYSATLDEKHFEYKLSDLTTGQTWVYNYEFDVWYGPFTYTTSFGDNIKNKVLSVIGTDIVEHNVGNTFDGVVFDTVVESVANDTKESFVDKNYRKFYIQTNNDTNAVFRYGKDFSSLVSKNISNMRVRNDYKHQGVAPTEGNSKIIYWELQSNDDGFELADMSWNYREKNRR